ncbi:MULTISPECIES: hypothetical protein [Paenibacillus]|uniref:spermine/spermidine synthase domain-containing protein n=1 Tax=Paenibacillus sanfengchensis TaxID=3119819 RepID=UPI002FE1FE7F
MELWFTEKQTNSFGITAKVKKSLHTEKTPYQQLDLIETEEFYAGIANALKKDGIFAAQTDNPWFKAELIRKAIQDSKEIFPTTRLYICNIPTYPSGMWTFTIGSKTHDPLTVSPDHFYGMDLKYYTPELHRASFVLPKFVEDLCK